VGSASLRRCRVRGNRALGEKSFFSFGGVSPFLVSRQGSRLVPFRAVGQPGPGTRHRSATPDDHTRCDAWVSRITTNNSRTESSHEKKLGKLAPLAGGGD
jgi:hypothetical protein